NGIPISLTGDEDVILESGDELDDSDARSDTSSEIMPKVQIVPSWQTSVLEVLSYMKDGSARMQEKDLSPPSLRPQLHLLTDIAPAYPDGTLYRPKAIYRDLIQVGPKPSNDKYDDWMATTPAPTTESPPVTVLGSRGRPATLKDLQALEDGESSEKPMLDRWLGHGNEFSC
ncbi:hypothetical protein LTR56_028252, partial [Elasticomyces elasticus]